MPCNDAEVVDVEIVPEDPGTDVSTSTCPQPMITTFLDYYNQIQAGKSTDEGINQSMAAIIKQFDEYGLTHEEKAKYIAEMYVRTASEFDKNTSNSALQLLKQEAETPLKCAQVALVERQHQGYDDSLLLKIMEQQGGLASFAVNSDSDFAQDTINDLKCQMAQIQSRSVDLPDEVECVITGAPTPIPSNLNVTNITDTTMLVSWNSVPGSTSYKLYMDGVEVLAGSEIFLQLNGLTPLTKYAFSVNATANGTTSGLSNAVIGLTLATPPPAP